MDDMTDLFHQKIAQANPQSVTPQPPRLDLWVELHVSGKTVISGVITGHPKHPDGMRILTSSIQGYDAEGNKRYAVTQRSRYELGERLEVKDTSYFLKALGSAQVLSGADKGTIC